MKDDLILWIAGSWTVLALVFMGTLVYTARQPIDVHKEVVQYLLEHPRTYP